MVKSRVCYCILCPLIGLALLLLLLLAQNQPQAGAAERHGNWRSTQSPNFFEDHGTQESVMDQS
jgi:hypothetical protein